MTVVVRRRLDSVRVTAKYIRRRQKGIIRHPSSIYITLSSLVIQTHFFLIKKKKVKCQNISILCCFFALNFVKRTNER